MAVDEYLKFNTKTPVFPIEWLVFKNKKYSDCSKFTKESDKKYVIKF